ncbi:MAG: hypothetical protein QW727_02515 [Candidatus Pacearchaeota archaeon]
MTLAKALIIFVFSILIIGGSFVFIKYFEKLNETKMTKSLCETSGGRWNFCGNKCQILNDGKPDVVCTQVCEEICECGTSLRLSCPKGYKCIIPEGVANALGYCDE